DMLEHADRHDAVEAAVDLAVVHEMELRPPAQAALCRPLHRKLVLFSGEGHADHLGAASFRQIEPEPAPARADIEHAHAGLDAELGGEVALLGKLGLLERAVRRLEIGTGILPVTVEEKIVDAPVDVVMMRHMPAGEADGIALMKSAQRPANLQRDLHPGGRRDYRRIAE